MKPSFALSFTEDSIQLLHREGKGWTVVGETPFAASDLDDALDYMRRTALGLDPSGIFTKLVIPNSQIRYLELDAPGPSDEERRTQILAGLEGKTPYPVADLVFDWSGKGKTVRVAVLARETLDEAEAFASAHRFNPLGFVAIPDYGDFSGEPWFGPTAAAASILPPGEEVEREKSVMRIQTRSTASARPAATTLAEDTPQTELDLTIPAAASAPLAEDPAPDAASSAPLAQAAAVEANETAEAASAAAVAPEPEPAAVEPTPPQHQAAPASLPDRIEHAALSELAASWPGQAEVASEDAAETEVAEAPPVTDTADAAPLAEEVEEAPFAVVPDDGDDIDAADGLPSGSPLSVILDEDDDLPPAPSAAAMGAFATRRTGGAPALGAAARPDAATLARAARGKPVEDLPPMPRPPQAGGARAAAPGKGLGGLVGTAQGRKGAKVKPAANPAPAAVAAASAAGAAGSPADAAKSLTRPGGTFGNKPPPPQRSRTVLFLSLVAMLLLCMALVAAWSTFYLAADDPVTPAPVQAAGTETPAVEDEMLADGEGDLIGGDTAADPAAGTDPAPAETADAAALPDTAAPVADDLSLSTAGENTAVPAAEPAPGTAVSSDSPATQPLAENQDEIFLTTSDMPPPALDALALPQPGTGEDALPADQMPPPPYGTVYAIDEQGLVKPTAEGIANPDGVMLIAGQPPRLPPSRSDAATAAATAAAAVAAPAPDAGAGGEMVEAVPFGETAGTTAPLGAIEAGTEVQPAPAAADAPLPGADAPDPALAGRRPKERPADLVTTGDGAALDSDASGQPVSPGLRPRERPRSVLAAAETARSQTEAASLALQPGPEDTTKAEAELAAATAAEAANPSVVAISRRPEARPKDFSRAVEAAVAAAIRAPQPEPEPEPEPEPQPAAKPKAVAKAAAKAPDLKPDEQDEANEPEVAAAASPKLASKGTVAAQATFKNVLNLSKVNLIGVYGKPSSRYALVRQSNGKFKKVKVGDRIDGGRIEAITQTEVRYMKGGRLIALQMPKE